MRLEISGACSEGYQGVSSLERRQVAVLQNEKSYCCLLYKVLFDNKRKGTYFWFIGSGSWPQQWLYHAHTLSETTGRLDVDVKCSTTTSDLVECVSEKTVCINNDIIKRNSYYSFTYNTMILYLAILTILGYYSCIINV